MHVFATGKGRDEEEDNALAVGSGAVAQCSGARLKAALAHFSLRYRRTDAVVPIGLSRRTKGTILNHVIAALSLLRNQKLDLFGGWQTNHGPAGTPPDLPRQTRRVRAQFYF